MLIKMKILKSLMKIVLNLLEMSFIKKEILYSFLAQFICELYQFKFSLNYKIEAKKFRNENINIY